MRTRKSIENEQTDANTLYSSQQTTALHIQALELEVLLDIRELMIEDKEERDTFKKKFKIDHIASPYGKGESV